MNNSQIDRLIKVYLKRKYKFTSFSCFQTRIKNIHLSQIEIIEKIKVILNDLHMKIIEIDQNNTLVHAESMWWGSLRWGETILISIIDRDDGACDVKVMSQPKIFFTIVDFGKGIYNVEEIINKL